MGDLESHDLVCRHLCKQTNAIVIAVDYKLAPEFKFPSQITETKDVVTEIIKISSELKIDENKIILCGDSAGGALATVGTIMSRNKTINPRFLFFMQSCKFFRSLLEFLFIMGLNRKYSLST